VTAIAIVVIVATKTHEGHAGNCDQRGGDDLAMQNRTHRVVSLRSSIAGSSTGRLRSIAIHRKCATIIRTREVTVFHIRPKCGRITRAGDTESRAKQARCPK
jgi:hypothetical protein